MCECDVNTCTLYLLIGCAAAAGGIPLQVSRFLQIPLHHEGVCTLIYENVHTCMYAMYMCVYVHTCALYVCMQHEKKCSTYENCF